MHAMCIAQCIIPTCLSKSVPSVTIIVLAIVLQATRHVVGDSLRIPRYTQAIAYTIARTIIVTDGTDFESHVGIMHWAIQIASMSRSTALQLNRPRTESEDSVDSTC